MGGWWEGGALRSGGLSSNGHIELLWGVGKVAVFPGVMAPNEVGIAGLGAAVR